MNKSSSRALFESAGAFVMAIMWLIFWPPILCDRAYEGDPTRVAMIGAILIQIAWFTLLVLSMLVVGSW